MFVISCLQFHLQIIRPIKIILVPDTDNIITVFILCIGNITNIDIDHHIVQDYVYYGLKR